MRKHHLHHLFHAAFPGGSRRHHGGGPDSTGMGHRHHHGRSEEGLPRSRRFGSDDLQLMLLALIAGKPSHGYELIKALDARSNGFYAPSPGMVYPALTYLEELGQVSVETEGNRKRYAIAEAGSARLAANKPRVDAIFARLEEIARKMDSVREAYAGGDAAESDWLPEYVAARYALKRALHLRTGLPAAEQRRIADILSRAVAEIERAPSPPADAA
ncbi:MAG TPA: PadR family transcriptional regulator [Paraburkholderia sp.]|jgi:DNA-binding PadR family transcriptional regulator|nr:PadR family transcriptional regulator [Paraburkholderia sp.]